MVTQGLDGYHCLLWAFDLCIVQQPVMGVCINLLWIHDLWIVQQPVMGFLVFALCDSLLWACATACYGWDSHLFFALLVDLVF